MAKETEIRVHYKTSNLYYIAWVTASELQKLSESVACRSFLDLSFLITTGGRTEPLDPAASAPLTGGSRMLPLETVGGEINWGWGGFT